MQQLPKISKIQCPALSEEKRRFPGFSYLVSFQQHEGKLMTLQFFDFKGEGA